MEMNCILKLLEYPLLQCYVYLLGVGPRKGGCMIQLNGYIHSNNEIVWRRSNL